MSDPEVTDVVPEPSMLDWHGIKVPIPAELDDVDPDVIEAFENDKAIGALRALFGSDEYDRARAEFKKLHGRKPVMRDFNALIDAVVEHFGFENAGE